MQITSPYLFMQSIRILSAIHFLLLTVCLVAMLPACTQEPNAEVVSEEVLLETEFEAETTEWPEKIDMAARTAALLTDDGYQLNSAAASYVWSFSEKTYEDVVLETAVEQTSAETNNAYGLVCRASGGTSRNGYYFLISGDGFVSIRRIERSLSSPIVDWTPHNAVRQGQRGNRLRAICVGNYLAFYVNGQLVAEGTDGRFGSGSVGFAASGSEDGPIQVTFTNFTVRAAALTRR